MTHSVRILVVVWAISFIAAARVEAQSTFGAVVGVVADTTDAVLPGATVTLTEIQTGVSRSATSRENGAYEFLNLTQGLYQIEVSLSGFNTYSPEAFRVEARETVRIDPVLQVSGVAEIVVVDDVRPRINTETPTIANALSNRALQELPFTFRTQNTSPIPAIQAIPEVQRVNNQFSLSGSLPYQNEVSVDGILTTNIRYNGVTLNNFPSIETIEEIKVSSVSNTAEFAQLGDITTISRPGTNAFHGTAFWNFNTTGLNANPDYFNKSLAPDRTDNHNIGASLAGPLARNRTFFFATFERLDIARSEQETANVPSAAFRRGDFSAVATPVIDPSTGRPFPGNMIPASRINPVAARLLERFIPAPNEGSAIHRYATDATQQSNQFDIRIDQNFSQGHTIFGRMSAKDLDSVTPTTYQSLGPRTDQTPIRTLALADNYALSSSVLNEARFGITSVDSTWTTGVKGREMISSLGLRLLSQNLPGMTGTPSVNIAGFSNLGEIQEAPLTQDTWQFTDNVTWVGNTHTVKSGVDVLRLNWTQPVTFTNYDEFGIFRFNNNLQGGTGQPFANFLLGLPTEVDQTASPADTEAFATHYGGFVQDDWRVNRNVTVSAGVRYDVHVPLQDRNGNITNFLRDTPNGDVVVPDEASRALTAPGFAASIGSSRILMAQEAGLPSALRRTDFNNVSPRLGIAWRPNGDTRTVIRGGYGVYSTRMMGSIFYSITAIHSSDNLTFANQFDPATRTHSIVWPNTFAGEGSRGAALRVGTQNFSTANDPNYKDPQTQQWSVTFERELDRANTMRVSYSGFRSTNLTQAPDLNQVQPNTIGYANLPREARPFPNWNRVNTRDNGGYQHYHDVLLQLRGDVARAGLAHVTSYKWAHSIDNIEGGRGVEGFQIEENAGRTDNRFDPDYMRGRTINIPDHRFVSTMIWNVPVGRGRPFGSDIPAALDAIAGGWTLSSIVQLQSGSHLTPYYSGHCASGTNCYGAEKPDTVSGQDPNNGPKTLEQWFNTAAFSNAAAFSNGRPIFIGRFGNAEKGTVVGPGVWNVDFAAFKDVPLPGAPTFRFSVLVTNLFNHANWGRPNMNLTSDAYGSITSLNSQFPLRTIVIGGRITY